MSVAVAEVVVGKQPVCRDGMSQVQDSSQELSNRPFLEANKTSASVNVNFIG